MTSGIYAIQNGPNGKLYIGSASKGFGQRWSAHRRMLLTRSHPNRHLQAAWNKHGGAAFRFVRLEFCAPDRCIEREQWWIDLLRPKYNISPTAGNCLGVKHSPETRRRISAGKRGRKLAVPCSPEHHANLRAAWKRGNRFTPVVRAKMSAASKNRKREAPTDETRAMIAASLMGHPVSVETRTKLRELNLGKTHGPHSPETRAKIGATHRGRKHTPQARGKYGCWPPTAKGGLSAGSDTTLQRTPSRAGPL